MSLCLTLGIEKPVIQAPMAGVQNWELALAVSEAGGLGSIPCGMLSPEQITNEIKQFREHSDKPYNLNFFCHTMPEISNDELTDWQQLLAPYYQELGIEPSDNINGLRRPFDQTIADVLESYRPPIMSFHFGLPSPELVQRIKSWGTVILSSATTVEEGLWLQENGADMVIAQGSEAGGHRAMFLTDDPNTQRTTAELVTELSSALSVPIIAAGGIASHQDVFDLMKLGAEAVQIGTSYLLCDEAKTSILHRQRLKDGASPTALTNLFSGRLARGISNRLMQDLQYINEHVTSFPYASVALAPLRAKAEALGRDDFSPLWAGINQQGCQEISASRLTQVFWNNTTQPDN
ncbi:NAD(P)H-dependent flavin oxidoreductase [Parendozoicomonas haliclonae]|uniref:Nitronate monooxygenase n=1 Tax=Parendozoicomonas haliclonae TaxID=1960125 RepID=A0A1X7AL37_9GAMM|nr:nitronate monooxygenase [Parendozoicomonas haliclonae]SMA47702.1 dihydroorotate dehydrogenase 1B [Parendozoicomonas haliclonae]